MQQKLFIENQNGVSSTKGMGIAPEDMPVSIRMPKDLEAEVSGIAEETSRSRNKAILLLLKRGIEASRADGVLVDTRPRDGAIPSRVASGERVSVPVIGGRKLKKEK